MRSQETSRFSFEIGDHDAIEANGGGRDHGHPNDIHVAIAGGGLRLALSRQAAETLRDALASVLAR